MEVDAASEANTEILDEDLESAAGQFLMGMKENHELTQVLCYMFFSALEVCLYQIYI